MFLNGAPADPLLLIGVGLTQGAVTRTAEYEIVVPGMNRPAMIFNMDSTFTSTNWANFSTTAPSGIGIEETSQIEVKVFPNPTSSDVSLTFEKNVNSTWRVTGYDLSGKQFYYDDIQQSGVVKKVIALPNTAGTYIVSVTDQNGKPLYSEQVVKQ